MFERYTERAARVIFLARYEASRFGSLTIETEHLLLGILMEEPDMIERFARPGETADSVRARVEQQITRRPAFPTETDIPLSAPSKVALSRAAEEADRLMHRFITTEHLFLGLLQGKTGPTGGLLCFRPLRLNFGRTLAEKEDPTATLLADAGVALEPVRNILANTQREELLRRGQQPNPAMEKLLRDFSAAKGSAAHD